MSDGVAVRVLVPGASGADGAGVERPAGRMHVASVKRGRAAAVAVRRAAPAAEPRAQRRAPAVLDFPARPIDTDADDLPAEPRAAAEPKRRGRPPGSGKGKPGSKAGEKTLSAWARGKLERGERGADAASAAPTRRVAGFEAAAEQRAGLLWLVDQLRSRGVVVTVTLTVDMR